MLYLRDECTLSDPRGWGQSGHDPIMVLGMDLPPPRLQTYNLCKCKNIYKSSLCSVVADILLSLLD